MDDKNNKLDSKNDGSLDLTIELNEEPTIIKRAAHLAEIKVYPESGIVEKIVYFERHPKSTILQLLLDHSAREILKELGIPTITTSGIIPVYAEGDTDNAIGLKFRMPYYPEGTTFDQLKKGALEKVTRETRLDLLDSLAKHIDTANTAGIRIGNLSLSSLYFNEGSTEIVLGDLGGLDFKEGSDAANKYLELVVGQIKEFKLAPLNITEFEILNTRAMSQVNIGVNIYHTVARNPGGQNVQAFILGMAESIFPGQTITGKEYMDLLYSYLYNLTFP
ncbi:MAG: hypothetical protein Q9M91_00740 [Candidatus Dojkabacteria bacterium]|nr:hypothetical protein [Candidatus Dojkabacteria bacterium]MDQ7020355.1 hypothetical protein [Candidatus Dojkabacteria bacterium]